MRLLLAADRPEVALGGHPVGAALSDAELARLYAYPARRPWVRANFVATVDGAAAGPDGRSASINTPADGVVFELLRALCDVVLVGAGTVRDESYSRLAVDPRWAAASERGPTGPVLALVSRRASLPPKVVRGRDGSGAVLVVTCASAPADALAHARAQLGAASVLVHGEETVDLAAAVADLAARGLPRVLCEGGPTLLGDLASAGLLDELCLTVSPLLVAGGQARLLAGPDQRLAAEPVTLVEEDGTLMGRWLVGRPGTP